MLRLYWIARGHQDGSSQTIQRPRTTFASAQVLQLKLITYIVRKFSSIAVNLVYVCLGTLCPHYLVLCSLVFWIDFSLKYVLATR